MRTRSDRIRQQDTKASGNRFAAAGRFCARCGIANLIRSTSLPRIRLRWIAILLVLVSSGCATHVSRVHDAHLAFSQGELDRSLELLDRAANKAESSRDCATLDQAVVHLVSGRTDDAEQLLRGVRDRFEHLEQNSLAERGLSWVTDENALAYSGEDYEKVLIHAFLALSDLMHQGGDATAYCLQLDQKQRAIIERGGGTEADNPKLAYQQVAFGAYLRGVLHEASHLNYDDAERCYAQAASWEPDFRAVKYDFVRVRSGVHSQPGNGVVYVFALVGRGPYKVPEKVEASQAALAIAETILFASGNRKLPPIVPPIQVPRIVVPQNAIDSVHVAVNGDSTGQTQTVTDVGRLAVAQQAAVFDHIVARAVARRAFKLGATTAAKEVLEVGKENTLASLGLDLMGLIWEASERADTRGWGLLPETIQVHRIELPAGEHEITLNALQQGNLAGPAYSQRVMVENGRDTYLLACFPDKQLVGQILTSEHPRAGGLTANRATANEAVPGRR